MADAPGPRRPRYACLGRNFPKGNRTKKVSRAYLAPQSQSHCGVCCYTTKIGPTPVYCVQIPENDSCKTWLELTGILKSLRCYRESAGRIDKTGHEARATTFCVTL